MTDSPLADRNTAPGVDAVDGIVADVRTWLPEVDPVGLPIVGRVLRLARYFERRREDLLTEFGLTGADFDVLATLRRVAPSDPVNVRMLQRSLMLSSGGMTKRLDRLETAGLVERSRDPADRRGVLIGLTADGIDLIERAVPAVLTAEARAISDAVDSPDERAAVEAGLRRLLLAEEG